MNNLLEKVMGINGCSIHYWVHRDTDRPWLILLHGAGADHRMFDGQLPVLSNKFNILTWDARGHGISRPVGSEFSIKLLVDDLLQIMGRESICKGTFIGQSMGGNIAQEMVFYHPDKVENLILIDCTCNTTKVSTIDRFFLGITPSLLSLFPWGSLVAQCAKASSIKPDVQNYLRECFNTVGKKDFIKIFAGTAHCLHCEEGYRINKNILLVCGECDNTGNIKRITPKWAADEQHCKFFMIKNAGHCSNQDNPDEFNRLLVEFLNIQYSVAL